MPRTVQIKAQIYRTVVKGFKTTTTTTRTTTTKTLNAGAVTGENTSQGKHVYIT